MDTSRTAPVTYCVSHECSLQNLPEHLITVTLKRVQVVPAVKERRGSWISEDERMEEHIFHSTRGRAEVVSGDAAATRAVLSLGQWSMKYKPQAERLQTHDSGMEQRPHQGGQTATKRGTKETHSVLSVAVCRTAGLTSCRVLAERGSKQFHSLVHSLCLDRQSFVSSFRASQRVSISRAGCESGVSRHGMSFFLHNSQYGPLLQLELSQQKVPLVRRATAALG